jgi:hypothetical protein
MFLVSITPMELERIVSGMVELVAVGVKEIGVLVKLVSLLEMRLVVLVYLRQMGKIVLGQMILGVMGLGQEVSGAEV